MVKPYQSIKNAFRIGPIASPRPVAVTNILDEKLFTLSGSKFKSGLYSIDSNISGMIGIDIIGDAAPSNSKPITIIVDVGLKPKIVLYATRNILTPTSDKPTSITSLLGNLYVSRYIMGHKQA